MAEPGLPSATEIAEIAEIVLASGSPRRRELLGQLGLTFAVRPPDIDESVVDGEAPPEYVRRLSLEKAAAVPADHDRQLVIAADTTVDVDGEILGKPDDDDDARRMLRRLSGRAHLVHTGVTVRRGDRSVTDVVSTSVRFVRLTDPMLDWYIATGEPFGKAGAYAIQGAGAALIASVRGSVTNVVGLPLAEVIHLARSLGVDLVQAPPPAPR